MIVVNIVIICRRTAITVNLCKKIYAINARLRYRNVFIDRLGDPALEYKLQKLIFIKKKKILNR